MNQMYMKKIYYLRTCDTCRKILRSLPLEGFTFQEIKAEPVTAAQLDELKALAGSYEALFSRRSKKYTAMGLKDQALQERDYRQLLLEEYTFLKRPVVVLEDRIFIGSSGKNVDSMRSALMSRS